MHKNNLPDRRIQRTRKALRHALLELIKNKEYDSISVEEITQRANLGRATFYLHYKDKEDLLIEEFNERVNERARIISEIPFSSWLPNLESPDSTNEGSPAPPLLMAFQHVKNNSDLYNILLNNKKSDRIFERIRKIITEAISDFMHAKVETDPIPILFEVPIDLVAAYFSGALLSSVNWWFEQELSHSPEDMARMFQRLFFPGAQNILNVPGSENSIPNSPS